MLAKGLSKTDLVTTPLQAGHEEDHARNGKKPADVVDLSKDFSLAFTLGVRSGWREVEQGGDDEGQPIPHTDDDATVPPAGVS